MNDISNPVDFLTAPSETTATQSSEETETYTWEVWRVLDAVNPTSSYRSVLERVGELVNVESEYRPWPWNGEREGLAMIAHLGKGEGDYWLVCGERVHRVSVVAETVYRLASEES